MNTEKKLLSGGRDGIYVSILLFLFWFIFPVISIFAFTVLLFRFNVSRNVETFILLLMALSFGLVGYTTQSVGHTDSDIARYYFAYDYIATVHTFNDFILSYLVDGGNNFLFYLVTFLMTRVFPDNPQVMPFFWVTVTYFFSFLTIRECAAYFSLSRKNYVLMIFFSLIGIITFYTTTEVIKQTASVAIFGYAILLKLQHKKGALWFAVISATVHFSSLILLPVYFLCTKPKTIRYLPLIFFFCLVLSFFNFNTLLYDILSIFVRSGDLLDRVQYYEDVKTWTISLRYYSVFVVYFLLVAVFYWDYFKAPENSEKKQKQYLLVLHSFAFFILLINRSNVHNFIRYILGYFTFYMIATIQLFTLRMRKNEKALLILLVVGFYIYSNLKMLSAQTVIGGSYGDSYMNNNLLSVFTSNTVQFFSFRVKH